MLYYLAGVSVVGTIGFGLFYLYDETTATAIMEDFSWSAVRAYHRVNMETNNLDNPKTPKRLVTEKEVSVMTEIPVMTLRSHRHLRRGLPFVRIGNLVRYDLVEVEQFLDEKSIRPAST